MPPHDERWGLAGSLQQRTFNEQRITFWCHLGVRVKQETTLAVAAQPEPGVLERVRKSAVFDPITSVVERNEAIHDVNGVVVLPYEDAVDRIVVSHAVLEGPNSVGGLRRPLEPACTRVSSNPNCRAPARRIARTPSEEESRQIVRGNRIVGSDACGDAVFPQRVVGSITFVPPVWAFAHVVRDAVREGDAVARVGNE